MPRECHEKKSYLIPLTRTQRSLLRCRSPCSCPVYCLVLWCSKYSLLSFRICNAKPVMTTATNVIPIIHINRVQGREARKPSIKKSLSSMAYMCLKIRCRGIGEPCQTLLALPSEVLVAWAPTYVLLFVCASGL